MKIKLAVNECLTRGKLSLQASKKWKEDQLDLSKQKVSSQVSAMSAATAQIVTLTSGGADETDYNAVGAAVNTM